MGPEYDRYAWSVTSDVLDAVAHLDEAGKHYVLGMALGNAMTITFGQSKAGQALTALGGMLLTCEPDIRGELNKRLEAARTGVAL